MHSLLTGDSQTRPNPFYFSLRGPQSLHSTAAQHSNPYLHPFHHPGKQADTTVLSASTATSVNQNLNIDEKMLAKLLLDKGRKAKGKKSDSNDSGSGGAAVGGRVASWAGPVGVGVGGWDEDDEEEEEEESEVGKVAFLSRSFDMDKIKTMSGSASASLVPPKDWGKQEKERARFDNLVIVVDDEGRQVEQEMQSEEDETEESGSEYEKRGKSGETNTQEAEDSEVEEEEEQRREAEKQRASRSVAKGELKR